MEASEGADGSVQSESEVDSSVDNGFESSGGSEEHVFDGLSSHDEDEASGSIRDVSVAGSDVDDADAEVSDGSDPAIDDEEMALICGECDEKMTELASADEELVCDGDCKRKLAPSEMRYVCTAKAVKERCDWDVCAGCSGMSRLQLKLHLQAERPPPQAQQHRPQVTGAGSSSQAAGGIDSVAGGIASAIAAQIAQTRAAVWAKRRAPQLTSDIRNFHLWQAERAAARAATQPAARQPAASASPLPPSAAVEPDPRGTTCAGLPVNTAPPAAATTATTPSTDYVLPTVRLNEGVVLPSDREERRQLVTQLLTADSPSRLHTIAFAREVFSQLPTSELVGEHVTAVFGSPEIYIAPAPVGMAAPSQTTLVNFRVELPFEQQLPLRTLTYQQRCDCCDDEIGTGVSGSCGALQLLATLEDEMKCRDEIILSEVNAGQEDPSSLLKSARFFMYRAFVAAKYGHLGKGNRVRIPECVVAVIRMRFRSPECDCDASAIGRCSAHGHTGYQAVSRREN
jgi:hypothetical protein